MNEYHIIDVNKSIKNKLILDNINLKLESGRVYGFVGKNGSGKTMLFRCLCGLMKPDSGKILYNEKELYKDIDCIKKIGVIIENVGLYPEFTGYENLKMLAKINKIASDEDIYEAIKRVGLDPEDKRTFRKYSLGMKQRIIIAQAIMEKPDVLLLDEPTNALDDDGVELLRDIVSDEKKRGALIALASHNKEDIEILCDEVYTVKSGKVTLNVDK